MKLRASYNKRTGTWSLLHDQWCDRGETSVVAQLLTTGNPGADEALAKELAERWNKYESTENQE